MNDCASELSLLRKLSLADVTSSYIIFFGKGQKRRKRSKNPSGRSFKLAPSKMAEGDGNLHFKERSSQLQQLIHFLMSFADVICCFDANCCFSIIQLTKSVSISRASFWALNTIKFCKLFEQNVYYIMLYKVFLKKV